MYSRRDQQQLAPVHSHLRDPTSAHKRKVLPVTLETLHFLRGLCDQVRVDQPLGCVEARNTVETLWKAVDELDAAIVETEKFTSSAL